jgi:hypothetical protein
MTTVEFAEILKKGIEEIPDMDGEPGYFADVPELTDRKTDVLLRVVIIDSERMDEEFEVTVRKVR